MTQHAPPIVSFIAVCDRGATWLDTLRKAAAEQTCQDYELVVVDNGCDGDDEQRALTQYGDARHRVVHRDRGPIASALNLGLSHALGQYICVLPLDWTLAPSFTECAGRAFDEDATIASTSTRFRYADGQIAAAGSWRLPAVLVQAPVAPVLIRRQTVVEVGAYDESLEDETQQLSEWDLRIRVLARQPGREIAAPLLRCSRDRAEVEAEALALEADGRLISLLIARYEEIYRRCLVDVLLELEHGDAVVRAAEHAGLLGIHGYLSPAIETLRAEEARLQQRRAALRRSGEATAAVARGVRDVAPLEAELRHSQAEVAALRQSISWRLTAPLRGVLDVVRRAARR